MLEGPVSVFFYLFSSMMIASAIMVVISRIPVHSVLFLILTFLSAAILFLLAGAEFLAMILLLVYVGAVAVLFLFVVMMLDVNISHLKRTALQLQCHWFAFLIGVIVLIEMISVFISSHFCRPSVILFPMPDMALRSNTQALGDFLYTDYVFYFQVSGLILLLAMIGAIVLTLRHRIGPRRQVIARQVARTPETAIEVKKVESNKGI
ncbi:MAG: NADH-quinone oxidoreductase subunit J [Candidatus Tokpelaia sp. JSC161]|nr:MAG: NADH-quinone oxidoreductase subunit J [Candidatus Tokpelaia sp. JSC161]